MSAFDEWITVLENSRDEVAPEGRKVVERGALNVKQDWARRWTGLGPHLPHLPSTVGYDVIDEGDRVRAEIGPDTDKLQGSIAHMIELGSVHNAPHPGGAPALDAEGPRFEQYVADLGEKLLTGD